MVGAAPAARAQTVGAPSDVPPLADLPEQTPTASPIYETLGDLPNEATMNTSSLPTPETLSEGFHLSRTRGKDPSWAKFASGTGNILFLSAGTLLPLIEDGKEGGQHSIRTADSLVVSTLLAEGLKQAVHKKRPDGSDYKSFPSGHATAAFTVATMQAHFHPKQAIFWYAGASAIAASRVKLHRHYTVDVLAGALLGFGTARLEIGQKRGLVLRPFIHQAEPGNRVTGVSFSKPF